MSTGIATEMKVATFMLSALIQMKQRDSEVYSVLVVARFGESDAPFVSKPLEERTIVTCTLGKHGHAQSSLRVREGKMSKYEIQGNTGQQTTSNITLFVSDIKGHYLTQREIGQGRLVQIVVLSDGAGREEGIHPNHCDAVGLTTGKRYAVFLAGCGDGVVMYNTKGFTVTGNKAVSPYFEMFQLQGERLMTFECNVTLCSTACNGSTCPNTRRKRSEKSDSAADKTARVRSHPIRLNHEHLRNDTMMWEGSSVPEIAVTNSDHDDSTYSTFGQILLSAFCAAGFLILVVIGLSITICYKLRDTTTPSKTNAWWC
ncbi:vitelline envelope sperm lysin receptor-like [Gigantopelta aegis]|uniref:vitelline envelope sperm lysin receptor-like n=1 Tax=Gigantopelta aegis TaxID=1735272 RepID=UPI001B88A783|nr:vitelline envelope sperm lysin receptor-like [Gigantopelta aegis]